MLQIYPNFLSEEEFNSVVSSLDRSSMIGVQNSKNVSSCPSSRHRIKKEKLNQFGTVGFNEILVYSVGGESDLHIDGGSDSMPWSKTGILICNDEYEGGELYFKDLGLYLKPPRNTFIIFPAGADSNVYAHGVTPVLSGERITSIFRFI